MRDVGPLPCAALAAGVASLGPGRNPCGVLFRGSNGVVVLCPIVRVSFKGSLKGYIRVSIAFL